MFVVIVGVVSEPELVFVLLVAFRFMGYLVEGRRFIA